MGKIECKNLHQKCLNVVIFDFSHMNPGEFYLISIV